MTSPIRHALPTDRPDTEAREDVRPVLVPVGEALGADRLTLFIGNLPAAEDADLLGQAGITESLNVALNLCPGPLVLPDGTQVRRYQVGLIDGPGNDPHLLAAAVQIVCGLIRTHTPGKPHYPPHRRGHVLVHCRGGRSRSALVAALSLHVLDQAQFPTLDAALDHVRTGRGLDSTYPLPPMITLGQEVLRQGLA